MRRIIIPPGGFAGFAQQTPCTQKLFSDAMGGRRSGVRRKRKATTKATTKKRRTKRATARRTARRSKPARLVKGSAAAKRHMAKLRRMRGRAKRR